MNGFIKTLIITAVFAVFTGVAAAQNLELRSSTPLSNVNAVDVVGDYAYCSYADGLIILDISDKTQPGVAGQLTLPGAGRGVISVSGDYALVLAGSYSVYIVNVSDPSNPILSSSFGFGRDFSTSNNDYAYTADPIEDIKIYNVSDPYNPVFVSYFNSWDSLSTVDVSGNYAYSAALSGLHIMNISNPASPFWVGRYPGDNTDWEYDHPTFVSGQYAYVALPFNAYPVSNTMLIIDVSDPYDPTLAGSYGPIQATDIYVAGDYAYAATGNSGFQIIDVSNPAIPNLVESYDTPGDAVGIFAPDEYIYVADNSALLILRFGPPVGCYYTVGDVNGDASYNGLDIVYSVMYFTGDEPPLCPECILCPGWYYCGDVNGSCSFNGMDITYGILYFRGGAGPVHCLGCPPVG